MVNRKDHHERENPHHIMNNLFLISAEYQAALPVSNSDAAQYSLVAFDIRINDGDTLWYVISIDPVSWYVTKQLQYVTDLCSFLQLQKLYLDRH